MLVLNVVLREEVLRIIKKYKFHPKQEYDQNFLVDDEVLFKILSEFRRRDRVFQVGLGLGTISYRLASRVEELIVYEIDQRLIEIFRKEFSKKYMRIKIFRADALKKDWPSFNKFFSSLPFSRAEPIIRRLEEKDFEKAVLIIPESLLKKWPFDLKIEEICKVPRESFYPIPDTSAVLVRVFKQ